MVLGPIRQVEFDSGGKLLSAQLLGSKREAPHGDKHQMLGIKTNDMRQKKKIKKARKEWKGRQGK